MYAEINTGVTGPAIVARGAGRKESQRGSHEEIWRIREKQM